MRRGDSVHMGRHAGAATVVNRYKVTTDTDSGITNDPCTGTDVIAVIERATYLGIGSEQIIKMLLDEFEPNDDWKPSGGGLGEFS